MKRKIIFLVNWSWQLRDYRRFGIELLSKRGFQPEIWDVGIFFESDPDSITHPIVSLPHLNHCVFKDVASLGLAIANLQSTDCIVSTFAENGANNQIFNNIRKIGIPYGISFLSMEPNDVRTVIDRATSIFFHFVSDWKLFLRRIFRRIGHNVQIANDSETLPSFIIVSGKSWTKIHAARKFIVTPYQGKIINAHNYDYDMTLIGRNENEAPYDFNSKEDYVLFIDQCLPIHFAFYLVDEDKENTSRRKSGELRESELESLRYCAVDIYYRELNQFFSEFESRMGLKIVIAAHPKSTTTITNEKFPDREVIFDEINSMVYGATCVLTHFSTAVSFSVIYKKPVLLLDSRNYHLRCRQKIRRYSKTLGCPIINISSKRKKFFVPKINQKKYDQYFTEFVKHPNSENTLLWENFSNYLEKNY